MVELLEVTILDCEKANCFKKKGLLAYVDRNRQGTEIERFFLNKPDLDLYIAAIAKNYVYALKFIDQETSDYIGKKV